MSSQEILEEFRGLITTALNDGTFIKVTLAGYKGTETDLKNIYVKMVVIKRQPSLAFTYRYKTRDIVKNYSYREGTDLIFSSLDAGFNNCTCFTAGHDLVLSFHQTKGYFLNKNKASMTLPVKISHDKEKTRLLPSIEKPYLRDLRITDKDGVVFKNAQDKYKQINQYVALLDPLLKALPKGNLKSIVDMGSGKGYLTFALYDYLQNVLKQEVNVTGVEFRPDLVELCNRIAAESGFNNLKFEEGSIEAYAAEHIDVLIALHACDTATDDAIFKGIKAGAELIVVAPCCHKQIRNEIERGKASNDLDFLTKHGIFMERQAVMVTDGIRALILEYFGYKTKVFEFISEANTPKNVLITGSKIKGPVSGQSDILDKIKKTKAYFGIEYHHLEKLLEL